MADETKLRFAQALRELMDEKPLDKISVIEIAERAGVSRKAFYNHFADKYDLLNWHCYAQFVVIHNEVLAGGWGAFKSFLDFFATDRKFFIEALRDMGQNSFGQYFSDLLFEVVYDSTYKGFKSTMGSDEWVGLAAAILVEDARMAIIAWLMESDHPNADELLDMLVKATDAFSSMTCLERALRHDEPMCDHAIDVFADSWSPDVDNLEVKLPKPDDPNARRRPFARTLAKCH